MAFTNKTMAAIKIANIGSSSFTWTSYPWPSGIPSSGDDVFIVFTGSGSLNINIPVTVNSLTISNSSGRATVTTNNTVDITTFLIIDRYTDVFLGAALTAGSVQMQGSSIIPPVSNPYAASTSNGAGLYCAANIVTTTTLSVGDYCFLGIGHEFGIDLNIQGIITSDINGKVNYYYNGVANQEIGTLPATVNDLIIDNPATVSLRQALTVNGTNLLKQGIFDIGLNKITYLAKGILTVPTTGIVGKMKADEGILDMRGNAVDINTLPIPQILAGTWFINNKVGTLINANVKGVSIAPAPALPLIIVNSLEYSTDGAGLVNIGGSTIYTNNNLTLQSNSSGTANFGKVSSTDGTLVNFINGAVSIERYLTGVKAWRVIAAPVQLLADDPSTPTVAASWREGGVSLTSTGYGTIITGPTGPNSELDYYTIRGSMKWYNEAIGANGAWVELANTTTTTIANKEGYAVFTYGDRSSTVSGGGGPAAATTLRIKGKLRTGDQEFIIPSGKYKCFGNPYPSRITFGTTTKINMQDAFTSWTPFLPGLHNVGAYKTFYLDVNPWDFNNPTLPNPYFGLYTSSDPNNPITGIPDIRNEIESGEGVFIHTAGPSNGLPGKIIIKESDKTTGVGSNVSRPGGPTLIDPRFARTTSLKIKLYSNNVVGTNQAATDISIGTQTGMHFANGLVVNFNDIYSQAVDNDDVAKISNIYDNISSMEVGRLLEANRRPFIRSLDTVFLNMGLLRQAGYRFDISNTFIAVYPSTLSVILKDKYLNTETRISIRSGVTTSYRFEVTSDVLSKATDRFMVVFINANAGSGISLGGKSAMASTTATNQAQTTVLNNGTTTSEPLAPGDIGGALTEGKLVSLKPLVAIYPNVITNGVVNLRLQNQPTGTYQLQVSNQLGQVIKTESIQVNTSNVLHSINIANAKAGSYQVFIIDKAGNKTTVGFMVN